MTCRTFSGVIDGAWQVSSYSALVAKTRDYAAEDLKAPDRFEPRGDTEQASPLVPAETAGPTETRFVNIILNEGPERAAEVFERFKPTDSSDIFFSEDAVNQVAYGYLWGSQPDSAIPIFNITLAAYPRSVSGWLGIAQAYMGKSDNEHALEALHKVRDLLPADSTFVGEQRQRIEHFVQSSLSRLEN